jgi:hypothetical protein
VVQPEKKKWQTTKEKQRTSIELQFSFSDPPACNLQACLPGQACSVTGSGTEARPRDAALARGPGESCGNRQADGEELRPSEE